MPTLTLNPVTGDLDVIPANTVGEGLTGLTTIAAGSILAANSLDTLSAVTSTSGLKVLKNNAGTTSWNTTTGTGDSVMATSPTFVTDLTSPIVYGSSSASGTLTLQSTSNATRGTVDISNATRAYTANDTLTAASSAIAVFTGNANISTGSLTALGLSSTITMTGNGSANGVIALFNAQFTCQDNGTGRTLVSSIMFNASPTYTATVAGGLTLNDFAGVVGTVTGTYFGPTLNRTGAGTGTAQSVVGYHVGLGTVGTGWTVTNWIGLLIDAQTVNGTLTNFYGVKNNVNAATNRWFIHSTGTAQNYLAGRLGIGIAVPLSLLHIEGASSGWILQDEQDSNPTTTELDANDAIAIYSKANTLTFAYNNGGTMTYLKIALDGSSTTWVHNTTGP